VEVHHPDIQKSEVVDPHVEQGLLPVYSETEGLNQKMIQKIVRATFENVEKEISESLPEWILKKYNLPDLKTALKKVHFPGSEQADIWNESRSPYQQRLIFEEFFWLELMIAQTRAGVAREKAPPMKSLSSVSSGVRSQLPFELTPDQDSVLQAISIDLQKDEPMHRLVQGDVGCGKTIVAFLAAAQVMDNGYQVALMAPTEILAEQHFLKAKDIFAKCGIEVALLIGGLKSKEAKEINERIVAGKARLIIGTHALIQNSVQFNKLGLVIIDEQHRFGVEQRAKLKQKGVSPHFLIMTATPIPRTLAMTVYGDLDVSTIKSMPQGRKPITTRVVNESQRGVVYGFIKEQLNKGHQVYIIYPLVEETEKMDLKNATDQAQVVAQEFSPFKVGLLHGRMSSEEKDKLMARFKSGEIKILVSTTVVEVGVDVPQATTILIEHAERFGLSQLHQLRGRVGRGESKSYCILMSGFAKSELAEQRLEIMTQTNDGFKIAEKDLSLRGPGEFLGTRQSGLPGFKLANLVRDIDLLSAAREAAFTVLRDDPHLESMENKKLKEALTGNRQSTLLLAQIG
jgi:ATP-dependent DNA helicase RecG